MKLKISEMFEHAAVNTDSIDLQDDSGIDKDRIRQLVLHKINGQLAKNQGAPRKRTSRKILLIAVVIVATLASAIGANAATGGKLFGAIILNSENRHLAGKPNYASMKEAAPGQEADDKRSLISNIIHENQLQTVNAASITNIMVEDDGQGIFAIPEILTNNGDLVIFTRSDETGWQLNKGQKLTVRFNLDLTTSKFSDPKGEIMEIGFIKNGELISAFSGKQKEFSYTIEADEAGEYYFYTENYSAGSVIIASGTIDG